MQCITVLHLLIVIFVKSGNDKIRKKHIPALSDKNLKMV
jgi:hypothetical protein